MASSPQPPLWVLWSTRGSIDNDVLSLTAIAETVLATLFYWWIAIHFATLSPLLLSVTVAPLVLLRSDESVSLGVRWFLAWEKSGCDYGSFPPYKRWYLWFVVTLSALSGFILAFVLGRGQSLDVQGWDAVWRTGLISFGAGMAAGSASGRHAVGVAVAGGTAAAAAATMAGAVRVAVATAGKTAMAATAVAGITMAIAMTATAAGTAALAVARAGVVAGAIAVAAAAACVGSMASAEGSEVAGAIDALLFVPGVAIGVFGVSVVIRVAAMLNYFSQGAGALPRNFRQLILCTSAIQTPELMPGLKSGETPFTFFNLWQSTIRERRSGGDAVIAYCFIPLAAIVWFYPDYLFRFALKSTAWFWWPLAFLGSEVRRARDPTLFNTQIINNPQGWARIAFSAAVILSFLTSNLLSHSALLQHNPFLTAIDYLFVVDWSVLPTQLLAPFIALLSLAIVFWLDYEKRDYQHAILTNNGPLREHAERQFGWIERIVRLRSTLLLLYWLLFGGHLLLYFNSLHCWFAVPENVASNAQWLYGARMPHGNCLTLRGSH